jgi:hypothetical protein
LQAGLDDLQSAKDFLTASMARLSTAKKESQLMNQFRAIGGVGGGFLAGVADLMGYGDVKNATVETNKAAKALNIETEGVLKTLAAREKLLKSSKSSQVGNAGRAVATIRAPKLDVKKQKEDPLAAMANDYSEFEKMVRNLDTESLKEAERMLKELPDFIPPVTGEMQKIIDSTNELNDSFDNIGNAVANSFKGMLTGAMSFKDAMKGIIGAVIDELFRLYVVQQVVGAVKGALGGLFGVPVPPGKAIGGSVGKNRPYMVGEQGPELFIPGGSGTIIPNRNLSSNGGGSSFNISVDARGSNDPAAVRAQVQQGILEAAPAIIAAAESRTMASMRRPRLGGVMQ